MEWLCAGGSGRCNSGMDRAGWKRYALVGTLAFMVFVALYIEWPWWIDGSRLRTLAPRDQAGILSSDRGDVLKAAAGLGAMIALIYTARKHTLDRKAHELDRQAYALSEQGQVTDRYTKAIAQLASDRLSERIGGIYALERVMADSERDHPTVVEVLAAFVREHSPRDSGLRVGERNQLASDVRAAMTVLARRPRREEPFAIDLRRTVLVGIELPDGARFENANFEEADLTAVRLRAAMVSEARFVGADLTNAYLCAAQLRGADFTRANLEKALLDEANLSHANLTNARLAGASAICADLTQATMFEADFKQACLSNAVLARSDASGSHMVEIDLTAADLTAAQLSRVELIRAKLNSANLSHANLVGANLVYASLRGADLTEAQLPAALDGVTGLEPAQLSVAMVGSATTLDQELAGDAWVRARISDCSKAEEDGLVPPPTPKPLVA